MPKTTNNEKTGRQNNRVRSGGMRLSPRRFFCVYPTIRLYRCGGTGDARTHVLLYNPHESPIYL